MHEQKNHCADQKGVKVVIALATVQSKQEHRRRR
jgi:hypothetical protein